MSLFGKIFKHLLFKDQIKKVRDVGVEQDMRIRQLTHATINHDEEWMLQLVKRSSECTPKIMEECQKNAKSV